MHIPDGILPIAVTAGGYAVTAAATWYALKQINKSAHPRADVPKAALLTAAFFVASWIHIPVPPTSVHLLLSGLLGVVLGWYAFPAILIGLFFQAVMFQHGGLTSLGVNAAMLGIPALVGHFLFQQYRWFGNENRISMGIFAFLGGSGALAISAVVAFTLLITTIPGTVDVAAEQAAITALVVAHIPVILLEGVFTMFVVLFLHRVMPQMLDSRTTTAASPEPALGISK